MLEIDLDTELIGELVEVRVDIRYKIIPDIDQPFLLTSHIVEYEFPGDPAGMQLKF